MQIERILMPTDFSDCAHAALGHAIFLAEQHSAELHLLHVLVLHEGSAGRPELDFPEHEEIYAKAQEVARGEMRKLIPSGGSLEIVERQRRAVAAAPEIVRYAAEEGMDLIVLGTHGRRGLRRLLLGSVADEVVRTAPCPVLTLRGTGGEPPVRRPDPVLVPIDFSERSRRALEVARELARLYGSRLALVHVVQHPAYPEVYPGFASPTVQYSFPQISVELGSALEDWARDPSGSGPTITTKVLEGQAAHTIAEYASEIGAGLIVLATHGLTGLSHFLLGSVAEGVIRLAECPVLTLKSGEEET